MKETSTPESSKEHFYYLDWLRVLAFAILLVEHSAEVFTNWNFWIKNEETSSALGYFISFFLPWRMPLLFMISGFAITLSFKRRTLSEIFSERLKRLLLPLIAAILLLIPPQIYFIKSFMGYRESFWVFYRDILTFKWNWSPTGNIHYLHLWYLAFVLAYSIMSLPLLNYFKSAKGKLWYARLSQTACNPFWLFSMGLLMIIPYFLLNGHVSRTLGTFAYFFPFFISGFIFAGNASVLSTIKRYSNTALFLAVLITLNFYVYSLIDGNPHTYFLNSGRTQSLPHFLLKFLNQWFWVLALFGLGMRLLNRPSNVLSYATKAVYPFYIFHQTVIVAFAYYIVTIPAPLSIKFLLIVGLSFVSILTAYEYVLKRFSLTRLMFGIKIKLSKREAAIKESRSPKPTAISSAFANDVIEQAVSPELVASRKN